MTGAEEGVLLASSVWRSAMLLNILHWAGQPPSKEFSLPNVDSAMAEKLGVDSGHASDLAMFSWPLSTLRKII